jgi:hypothetical protein
MDMNALKEEKKMSQNLKKKRVNYKAMGHMVESTTGIKPRILRHYKGRGVST